MKSFPILLFLFAVVFSAFAHAAPVTARYLRFEGYYSTHYDRINIHEIEAYANGLNVAPTAAITINSGSPGLIPRLTDGITTGSSYFYSESTDDGPSEEVPHWVQMDFGSAKPLERIRVYMFGSSKVSFGLFLSDDGVSWTPIGRYNEVGDMIQNDPSAPLVIIQSAAMRPGTTLMDVVYRVNDPDDATVQTRALAFVDGVRSFANVLKPVTLVEGTAANLGDTIAANVDHTLTWDVATDWEIDLGQIKFEVLARDGALLPLDWITIPAAGSYPELTVSQNSPSNHEVLNALFWQYADGDPGLSLTDGLLSGNASSGVFDGVPLVAGTALQHYSTPFIFKRMNLDADDGIVAAAARAGLNNPQGWHAANRPYAGLPILTDWGNNRNGWLTVPAGLSGVTAIAAGGAHCLALRSDGTVAGWGLDTDGQITIPDGLGDVTAIAAGSSGSHSLALKSDGTVVGWGRNTSGEATPPAELSGVTTLAAGGGHSLALKSDGTVVAWGNNIYGQATPPTGLSGVIAIAAGGRHSLALKNDGTVVGWGHNDAGQINIPVGLSGVTAIAAGYAFSLALKSDGTVVSWGSNSYGAATPPAGLSGVAAISAGYHHSLALKSDGTVVGWGSNSYGEATPPAGLRNVTAIAAGSAHSIALQPHAP